MSQQEEEQGLDLEALADHYDEESRDTYLSSYADLTSILWERALDARYQEIKEALGPERAEAIGLDSAYDEARSTIAGLQKKGAKGAAIFLSPRHDLHSVHPLGAPMETRLVLDSSPYLMPLARYHDAYAPFLLVLLDGARGAVWRVEADAAELEGSKKMDLIGRHKKGGFSQMRYQRHRAGRVDHLLDELIAHVEAALEDDIEHIVVAGPGQTKDRLVERMPQHLHDKIAAVQDLDLDDPRQHPAIERFVRVARGVVVKENTELAERLKDEVCSGGLATTGAFAAVRAARDGRVDTLVVLRGKTAGGRKCEEHQAFFAANEKCECGEPGTEVDLLNEAVEQTLRTDGEVAFVEEDESPFLAARDGIGAFLRW